MLAEQNFVFVLVRPNFLGNIGSSARVMKNFGFSRLRLVEPPRNYLDSEARRMAVDAFDVLKKAQVFDTLAAALADINLAVATSSGQYRRHLSQNLDQFLEDLFLGHSENTTVDADNETSNETRTQKAQIKKDPAAAQPTPATTKVKKLSADNTIAIIFGDERNGLTNEEIDCCHKLMRIESSGRFPSLNLAQALGIVAYALAQAIDSPDNKSRHEGEPNLVLMTGVEEEELMEKIGILMDRAQFSRSFNRKKIHGELRNTLQRLQLSQREGKLWLGFLATIIARLPEAD